MKSNSRVTITLANGRRWAICPSDEGAATVVRRLGQVMGLQPQDGPACELHVMTAPDQDSQPKFDMAHNQADGDPCAAVYRLRTREQDASIVPMYRLASALGVCLHGANGAMFHAALAERDGIGVLLAGPSGAGKTTTSLRLTSPWRSLSDDATLVVRDANGRYWAHPWPTWSRFLFDEDAGVWDVQHATLLGGIFFLEQSPSDRCEPVDGGQAVCYLLTLAEQASLGILSELDRLEARQARLRRLDAVCDLVRSVPAYRLHVALKGQFWREVERVLGYVSSNPLSVEAQARISHHIQPLVSPHGTIVEIHWTLVRPDHPFKPDLDGLWERARPAEVAGVLVRVLSAEDTLIYLSFQAAQDRFIHALKYVCDIAQVVARYQHEINWRVVSERARSWGGQHSVYLALYLARDLLGAEVPDETLAELRPASFDARLAVWARDRLLRRAEEAQPLGPKFMRAWNAPTWGARCRNLAAMLFPPRDVVADLYHVPADSRRVYWFYLVRLKNELRRTYRTLGRLLIRDRATASAAEQDKALAEWLESG